MRSDIVLLVVILIVCDIAPLASLRFVYTIAHDLTLCVQHNLTLCVQYRTLLSSLCALTVCSIAHLASLLMVCTIAHSSFAKELYKRDYILQKRRIIRTWLLSLTPTPTPTLSHSSFSLPIA